MADSDTTLSHAELIAVLTRIAEAVEVIAHQLRTPPKPVPPVDVGTPTIVEPQPEVISVPSVGSERGETRPLPRLKAGQVYCPECAEPKPDDSYKRCFECNMRRKEALADCPRCGTEKSTDLSKYSQCWTCTQTLKQQATRPHLAAAHASDPDPF